MRLVRLEGLYGSTVELILVSTTVLAVWLAAPQALVGQMTVGALVAYLGYLTRFCGPLKGLSRANFQIQRPLAPAQRIFPLLDTPTETEQLPAPSPAMREGQALAPFPMSTRGDGGAGSPRRQRPRVYLLPAAGL